MSWICLRIGASGKKSDGFKSSHQQDPQHENSTGFLLIYSNEFKNYPHETCLGSFSAEQIIIKCLLGIM